jgi:acetylornithine/succinyldiaminopimelate/putrescine aminotransferase
VLRQERLQERAADTGDYLQARLRELQVGRWPRMRLPPLLPGWNGSCCCMLDDVHDRLSLLSVCLSPVLAQAECSLLADVRGHGLMVGIEVVQDPATLAHAPGGSSGMRLVGEGGGGGEGAQQATQWLVAAVAAMAI